MFPWFTRVLLVSGSVTCLRVKYTHTREYTARECKVMSELYCIYTHITADWYTYTNPRFVGIPYSAKL